VQGGKGKEKEGNKDKRGERKISGGGS